MSKIRIVPFKAFHVGLMELREWDRVFLMSSPDFAEISSKYFERNCFGFTGLSPDGIVGAAGFVKLFAGTYEGWAYTTPLFPKYGIQIHRIARRLAGGLFSLPNVFRLQAPVDSLNPGAIRWVEGLGLKHEGTLRRYGPQGQDFLMFARTKE